MTEPFGDLAAVPVAEIRNRLDRIGRPDHFTFDQAVAMASLATGADLALDLGTAQGNSATVLGLVCRHVHTFDVEPCGIRLPPNVMSHLTDIAKIDFAPFVHEARRIFVFWDAHGFDIAEAVLSRLMPLIADRTHVVLCHDISDNRYSPQASYNGRRLWRGLRECDASPEEFAYVNLGWSVAVVDQLIPILDFCHRNAIDLHSVDHDFANLHAAKKRELRNLMGHDPTFHMAHFSMASARNFPRAP